MSAAIALRRLRDDQSLREIAASRVRLASAGVRLDMAARAVLTRDLVERVRTDRRYAPALQGLVRISLRL